MKSRRTSGQRPLCCPCGRTDILALGLCGTCYTLKRQDAEYFGGLREQVLERDGYACRVCGAPGRTKRSIIVHHRKPGVSTLPLMISLCPACHAKVERLQTVLDPLPLPPLRCQHPFPSGSHDARRGAYLIPAPHQPLTRLVLFP